jgi:hypothetical protein
MGKTVARTSIGELYHKIQHMSRVHTETVQIPSPISGEASPSIPVARIESEDAAERAKRTREQIIADAKANAAFYEEAALKDEMRKPWFQYVRKQYQYGEFVMLSPEMAEELLRFNPDNRNMKPWLTAAYKRDMERDNWIPSHEGIGINLSGNMFDGQHRAEGVVESKKSVPIWIVFNVLDEAKFVADSGAKRNVNEKLAMVCKVTLPNRTAGMIKAMMRGIKPKFKFSEAEIALFANNYANVIGWIGKYLPSARADVQAALGKAYLWYGPEKLEAFCDRLREANWTGDNDPAKTLFFYLQRLREQKVSNPISTYKKTIAAIGYVISGTPCGKLYESQDDIFEWDVDGDGNFHVPPKNGEVS